MESLHIYHAEESGGSQLLTKVARVGSQEEKGEKRVGARRV